jgi:hypothetical protein
VDLDGRRDVDGALVNPMRHAKALFGGLTRSGVRAGGARYPFW